MSLDPYGYCQCGSGKKFKWCCQPIYGEIQHALELHNGGQHEPALRAMEEAVKKHPDNPEVWGRRAELLYANQRVEDAEASLQKAFDINANYPYGLLLQSQFRYAEGEMGGALLLARRAVEAYHPSAMDALAVAYGIIFDIEMRRQRPVAARAAMTIIMHANPGDEELRENFNQIFGEESRLPDAARREYKVLGADAADRAAWDKVLADASGPRLGALAKAFEQLTEQDANDVAAWFNRGLTQAWLGENVKGIEAFDRFLEKTDDEAQATTAGALAEVLRAGQGLEEQCDYREFRSEYEIRDFQGMSKVLEGWGEEGRMIPLNTENTGSIACILLESGESSTIITSPSAIKTITRLGGYLFIGGNRLRLWSPLEEPLTRLKEDLRRRVALGVSEGRDLVGPIAFADVVAPALTFPMMTSQTEAIKAVLDNAAQYFEHTWVNRRLLSLGNTAPADAATTFLGRKKLLGVVKFLEDCAQLGTIAQYDFNRLRTALGLAAAAAPVAPSGQLELNDVGGLAALDPAGLSEEQLDQAYQAAQRLGSGEQRDRLAKALLERAPGEGRSDRYPLVSGLVQQLLQEGRADEALDFVNEGERNDCEHNEGRRRNDYELRRAQIHVKRREADVAHDVFRRLIERVPDNLKIRGSAIEGMLSLKQGPRAMEFAEDALKAARVQKDRDAEQHFTELLGAAKRL